MYKYRQAYKTAPFLKERGPIRLGGWGIVDSSM